MRYEIPEEPDGAVKSVYGNVVYSYWPDREQWVSNDGASAYSWEDLVREAGPLVDYEPQYKIVANGSSSLDFVWDTQDKHSIMEQKLENYARGIDMGVIKVYERGVRLITDTTAYVITEV